MRHLLPLPCSSRAALTPLYYHSACCCLLLCGLLLLHALAEDDHVTIWVQNSLLDSLHMKLMSARKGRVPHTRTLQVPPDSDNYNFSIAFNSRLYDEQRPWFMIFRIQMNSSEFSEFALDPLFNSPSFCPTTKMGGCAWHLYGRGIFYTRTNSTGHYTNSTKLFCTWEASSVPPSNRSAPSWVSAFVKDDVVPSCNAYKSGWDPTWISVSNTLKHGLKLTTLKDENSTSVNEVNVDGAPEQKKNCYHWPKYGQALISPSYEHYEKHRWRVLLTVQGDPKRSFRVTIWNPLGIDFDTNRSKSVMGCMLVVNDWGVLTTQIKRGGTEGSTKHICTWHSEEQNYTYCGNDTVGFQTSRP